MKKSQVKKIEAETKKLMTLDSSIWEKYGWQDGSQVDMNVYKNEIRKKISQKSIDPIYFSILEDANFHSLNKALEEIGAFKKKFEGDEKDEEIYNDYKNSGGRTWNVWE